MHWEDIVIENGDAGVADSDRDVEIDSVPDAESMEVEIGQDAHVRPTVTIDAGPDARTNDPDAEFFFDCDHPPGCQFACSLNGAGFEHCGSPRSYPELADGDHHFAVVATVNGGPESDTARWEWTIDTAPPEVTIVSAPPVTTSETSATFEFECTNKPSCSFECAFGTGEPMGELQWQECSSGHTIDDLAIGDHEFHIQATDDLGNQGLKTVGWAVTPFEGWEVSTGIDHSCGVRDDNRSLAPRPPASRGLR